MKHHDLDALVRDIVDGANLSPSARRRATDELRAHIEDAFDAGLGADEIRASFGDPALTAALLRRSPPPQDDAGRRRVLTRALAVASAAVFVAGFVYAFSAHRLGSFDNEWSRPSTVLDSTARVARLRADAKSLLTLGDAEPVRAALRLADSAWATDEPFGRFIALTIVADAMQAATEVTSHCAATAADRVDLAARFARWSGAADTVSSGELRAWFDEVVSRAHSGEGATIGRGLRVIQAMKGVRTPSAGTRLLEPLYFARATSPGDVWSSLVEPQLHGVERAIRTVSRDLGPLIGKLSSICSNT